MTTPPSNTERWKQYDIHTKAVCQAPCPFHAPSNHTLKDAPIHIRTDKGMLVERICPHGVGHDDPDSAAYLKAHGQDWAGVHGCDGCCTGLMINLPESPARGQGPGSDKPRGPILEQAGEKCIFCPNVPLPGWTVCESCMNKNLRDDGPVPPLRDEVAAVIENPAPTPAQTQAEGEGK